MIVIFFSEQIEGGIDIINKNISNKKINKNDNLKISLFSGNENGENEINIFMKNYKEEIQYIFDDINNCQKFLDYFKDKLDEFMKDIEQLDMLYNRYKKDRNNISFSIKELNCHYDLLKSILIFFANNKKNKINEKGKNKDIIKNGKSSHLNILDLNSSKDYTSLKIDNLIND